MQVARYLVNCGVPVNNVNQRLDAVLLAKKYGRTQFLTTLMSLGAHDVDAAKSKYADDFARGIYFREEAEDELFYFKGKY
jgi:hypothetical protein